MLNVRLACSAADLNLLLVKLNIPFLQFAHFLNFVKIDHKAFFQIMQLANALTTENSWVLGTVKMLDSLIVFFAEIHLDFLVVV